MTDPIRGGASYPRARWVLVFDGPGRIGGNEHQAEQVTPIPLNQETEAVARRLVWFEEPAIALADPIRFMAYAMAAATHEDMQVLRRYVSDDDFREALDKAPPGIIDPRSWAYWNSRMGRYPPPPMPRRRFD